jgi:hypothetical protein
VKLTASPRCARFPFARSNIRKFHGSASRCLERTVQVDRQIEIIMRSDLPLIDSV